MASLHFLDPNPTGKPVVLLLHGLGADGSSWTLQLPALSRAGFRPLAPDAPGFGGSPYDGGGWNIRRVAAQMAGLLEELGGGPAHIVGLSMGGVIAQQFALDFPQLTKKTGAGEHLFRAAPAGSQRLGLFHPPGGFHPDAGIGSAGAGGGPQGLP